MEIKINNNGERIPATLEVVDGVMIVSPVKDKDISQFKDGDVVVYHYGEGATTIAILQGEVDTISKYLFIEDYVSLDSVEGLLIDSNYTDAATDVRYATEGEKKKLFDKIAEEGYEWDADKRKLVKLKWKPKIGETCFAPHFDFPGFIIKQWLWEINAFSTYYYDINWVFQTKEECEAFCKRLNQAIEGVKP